MFWDVAGTPCITDCVMAELEKLGQKYRVALRYAYFHWIRYNILVHSANTPDCKRYIMF